MTALRDSRDGRRSLRSREDIIEALRLYGRLYGEDFTASSFSPASAKWNDRADLIEVYYNGMPPDGRPWPSLNSIKSAFGGSFNDARVAAGLPPNRPGPANRRRPAGDHAPIRTIREHRVFVSDERLADARRRQLRAEERAMRAVERAERAEAKVRLLSERLLSMREAGAVEVAAPPPRERSAAPRIVTKTKTVKVRDERAIERLRGKLADAEAATRAARDQAAAEAREHEATRRMLLAAERMVAEARAEAALRAGEATEAIAARDRLADEVEALGGRVARLTAEVEAERERALGVSEAAAASLLVREAEDRVEEAERRAARAERIAAEHAAAATGTARVLTKSELAELRSSGPAGEVVLGRALRRLARARSSPGDLSAALREVASAAVNWADRVR